MPTRWYHYLEDADVIRGNDWDRLSDRNPFVASFNLD